MPDADDEQLLKRIVHAGILILGHRTPGHRSSPTTALCGPMLVASRETRQGDPTRTVRGHRETDLPCVCRYRSSHGLSEPYPTGRPTGISRVPQELIDRILDCLHEDSVALRSCSFVCRSWLKQSRHHLFGLLRIRDTQVFTSLKSRPVVLDRFKAFYHFITSVASPGLCAKVHTLYLLGNEERQGPESFLSAQALSIILGKLPRVRILELNRVHFSPVPPEYEITSLSKIKLEVLSIGRVNLEEQSPDGLFSVLGLFSNLGMLRISYLETPRQPPTDLDIQRVERLQVQRFSLKGHSTILPQPSRTMPYMLSAMLNSSSFLNLETIEIKCCTIDQIHAFGATVNVASERLTSIAVDISDVVKVTGGASPKSRAVRWHTLTTWNTTQTYKASWRPSSCAAVHP